MRSFLKCSRPGSESGTTRFSSLEPRCLLDFVLLWRLGKGRIYFQDHTNGGEGSILWRCGTWILVFLGAAGKLSFGSQMLSQVSDKWLTTWYFNSRLSWKLTHPINISLFFYLFLSLVSSLRKRLIYLIGQMNLWSLFFLNQSWFVGNLIKGWKYSIHK